MLDMNSYRISDKTVAHIAEKAVLTVPGSLAVDAKLAGLAGRSLPQVEATIDRSVAAVTLDIEMAASYPAPVRRVTDEVRRTVTEHVRTLTGLSVSRVNISVAEIKPSEERVTHFDLDQHPAGLVPARIDVAPTRVWSPQVAEQIALADIEVDDSTYDNLREIHVPEMSALERVVTPAPMRLLQVTRKRRAPLTPVHVRRLPVYSPSRPAPQALRGITVNQFAPDLPEPFVPAPRALTPVTIQRPAAIRPVSLPARTPLQAITVQRAQIAHVERPMPQPLRAVGAPAAPAVSTPTVPEAAPLAPIEIVELPEEQEDEI